MRADQFLQPVKPFRFVTDRLAFPRREPMRGRDAVDPLTAVRGAVTWARSVYACARRARRVKNSASIGFTT